MKKILSFAAAILLMASCNGKADNNMALNDSVSALFGEMYGYGVAGELRHGPDSAKFDTGDFLAGLKMVASMDTTDKYKMQGIQMGLQFAQVKEQIKQMQGVDINLDLVVKAFEKAFTSKEPKDPQQLQMVLMEVMQRASREAKLNDPVAKKNKEDGEAYMAKKAKEGYKKTASGLLYKVIAEGQGDCFTENQIIEMKYCGKHINGEVFDQTTGEETRPLSPAQVVPGFKEALLMMKPGSKMEVIIPSDLGYGPDGRGSIQSNEVLTFTIETIKLKEEPKQEAAQPAK